MSSFKSYIPRYCIAALALIAARSGSAAIVGTGTGTQNQTAPAGLSYWNNIGVIPFGTADSGGSGVYLGNHNGDYWVLTAKHAVFGSGAAFGFNVQNVGNFTAIPNSQVYLSYQNTPSDLALFKINPSSPAIANLQARPQVQFGSAVNIDDQFTFAGEGRNRAATLTHWRLTNPNDADNTVWTNVTGTGQEHLAQRHGYYQDLTPRADGKTFARAWMQNNVNIFEASSPFGSIDAGSLGITRVFGSDFTASTVSNPLPNEGQVAPGDSGGGAFVNNRLVGLALYLGDDRNGPYANSNPGSTDPNPPLGQPLIASVFDNWSYYADLSSYVDQIASVTGLAPSITGDADLNGIVDNADFKILYANFGLGTKWTQGDFNLDGKIDFIDFQMLEANFGKTSPIPVASGPTIAGVPEPATLAWIGLGGMILMARRARK